jgi:hypothetical protein
LRVPARNRRRDDGPPRVECRIALGGQRCDAEQDCCTAVVDANRGTLSGRSRPTRRGWCQAGVSIGDGTFIEETPRSWVRRTRPTN